MLKFLKKKLQNSAFRHHARITVGIIFIILGILGLILPILQGVLNLSIAVWLLAPYIPFLKKALDRLYKKYPSIYQYHLKVENRFNKWINS
jgi:uncharacterized membrane protein YbaN (DUF454 family)